MVFLSLIRFVKTPNPDQFWKRRRVFQLTAHHYGRRRNCYSIAIRSLNRALQYATKGRKLKKINTRELWDTRIEAACQELGTNCSTLTENLGKCLVQVNHKALADLAIWEPRTFESLTRIARMKNFLSDRPSLGSLDLPPDGVITRGML